MAVSIRPVPPSTIGPGGIRAGPGSTGRAAGRHRQAGRADLSRGVHDNGRRSRFATPGGGRSGLHPRSDGRSPVDGRAGGTGRDRGRGLSAADRGGGRDGPRRDGLGRAEAPPAEAKVTIEPRSARPWDFGEDIVPILTRLGCNTGACHGRLEGQNGFHLSLFGYDPAGDYPALARDAGQRRLSRLAPDQSLFLVKATGHGPARRRSPDCRSARRSIRSLLAWVRDGAPEHRGKTHGAVASVASSPAGRPAG